MRTLFSVALTLIISAGTFSQEISTYKETADGIKFYLSVHIPSNAAMKNPAIVFLHGGQVAEEKENAEQDAESDIESFERERILKAANRYLTEEPVTVTVSICERSSGGPNDYYSEGDYWWPDPDNPDGPYIRRDGQTNPDNFTDHRVAMRNMSIWVPSLVAAYKISGDEKFALHAIRHLKAWFINPATLMNPNLLFGQAIKGRFTGRGIGIIDTIHLIEVARSIQVLGELGILAGGDLTALRNWFREYLDWITTHPYGIDERDHGNNHSTWWAAQVAAFAVLVGDMEQMEFCRKMYRETLLPDQMSANGSFEGELSRTKPYSYSLFNLEGMAMLCELLSDEDHNLWNYELPDGRSIALGIEFMYPYVKDKSTWFRPPDVMYFDEWPVRQSFYLFAGRVLDKPELITLWRILDPDPTVDEVIRNCPIRQPVLWL